MAELTDYQKGVQAGIQAGFSMGRSYQQSYDGRLDTGQYNQAINNYDQTIQSIFASNQTAINTFIDYINVGCNDDSHPICIPYQIRIISLFTQ